MNAIADENKPAAETPPGARIAKHLARAGICSRREAEALIAQGRVSVDGRVLESPALNVMGTEDIRVDGARLPARERPRLWRYHKPKGLMTTHKDPQGRPTVFDDLRGRHGGALPRVVSAGRLDLNTEGLLLLTNDGALAQTLETPKRGWTRRYRVRAFGRIDQAALDALKGGVEIAGVRYGPIAAALDRRQGDNLWLTLAIKEGKNREVRNICEYLGLKVNRLIRTAFGPFQLGALKPGEIAETPAKTLREQLGAALATELGLAPPRRR